MENEMGQGQLEFTSMCSRGCRRRPQRALFRSMVKQWRPGWGCSDVHDESRMPNYVARDGICIRALRR